MSIKPVASSELAAQYAQDTQESEKVNSDSFPDDKEVTDTNSNELHLVTSENAGKIPKTRGVRRIENVKLMIQNSPKGKTVFWAFAACLLVIAWVVALDGGTTYSYQTPAASSFKHHSMISTVNIATSIVGSVMRPFLAKLSDITSRPLCYAVALLCYTIGSIVCASAPNIYAFVVGNVLTTIGSNGIDFLNTLISADLTPLEYRGLALGVLSTPWIINVWFSGLIVDAVLADNWRWGYGMFAIIMPVTVIPSICVLFYFENKAQKLMPKVEHEKKPITKVIWNALIEIDAFGLLLLGFGWSLLLLPFSLYSYANGGWKNASMIAMVVVGGVLLIVYPIYEIWFAPFPSMPKRIIFNKTFITAVLIDFIYQLDGGIRTYFSTILWVYKDWSIRDWTYFNNTLTVGLCFFGVIVGIICKFTHRYKWLQFTGIAIRIIGYGLAVRPQGTIPTTGSLVMGQVLISWGGACSVIGTQVASQASVPHQDLGLVMSVLSLWSNIGAAVGAAIASPVWTSKLPGFLAEFLPLSLNATEIYNYYSDVTLLRYEPWGSDIRMGGAKAYSYMALYFFAPPVGIEVISLILSLFQTNYHLGKTQNAIEIDEKDEYVNPEIQAAAQPKKSFKDRLAYWLS